jgi:ribonuclease Z
MTDSQNIGNIFWKKKWKIPNTSWNISGYSRSAYRTGFYIPELSLMLDAGPQNFNNPEHIFITHSHVDHLALLPFTLIENEKVIHTNIYGPKEADKYINNYILSLFSLNVLHNFKELDFYTYNGLHDKDNFKLNMNNNIIEVNIYKCDHRVPTIGYGLVECKQKLKEEYLDLPGKEIGKLRKEGVEITKEVKHKRLVYVCDTSIKVFELNPDLLTYQTIFIECTFFMPDELENARETKHIHWSELKKYVVDNPHILFVLFHFSKRYKDCEILDFFKKEVDNGIKNIYYWQ